MELFQAVPSSSILLSASPYEKLQWKVEEVVVDFDAVRALMPLPAPFGAIWCPLHFGPWRSSFECEPVTCSSCARRPRGRASGARWRPRTSIRLARPRSEEHTSELQSLR